VGIKASLLALPHPAFSLIDFMSYEPRLDLKQLALLDEFFFLSDAASDLRQLPRVDGYI